MLPAVNACQPRYALLAGCLCLRPDVVCYCLRMASTTEQPERTTAECPAPERKEPTYLFSEKHVADKSELARRFIETRARLNANVDKANNFLVKRFYNVDHNTYREGALPAKTKELMGLVASACLRCDDCVFYHAIQAYRRGRKHRDPAFAANV